MKRSTYLVSACSAALVTAWAGQGFAQSEQQTQNQTRNQTQSQQTQKAQQGKQQSKMQGQQRSAANVHGTQAVIESAGQPTNVLIVGEVTDARDVTLAGTAGDKHRLLKVKPSGGKEVVVDIGVRQGVAGDMQLEKGDRIVAMGKPARINGRPVLFAANVAEMQRVNVSTGSNQGAANQGATTDRSMQQAGNQRSAQQRTNQQASQQEGYDAVIYLFDTNNYAEDDYGLYDEDFVWITSDPTYDTWNDTALAWEDTERAHYDMFGYDDAGENGLWDW